MMVTFKSDISKRKKLFTAESFSHPAKMHLGMLLWIVGKYTKPGETILDPMFGAGSTMLAARYGRNVVGVELEQKFVDMAKDNWGRVVGLPKTKFGLGECQIICGDARELGGLLVDSVITSPPYGEPTTLKGGKTKTWQEKYGYQENDNKSYGQSDGQIGQMSYGSVDKIITSPPYEATFNEKQHTLSGIAKRDPSMRTEVGGYSGDKRKEVNNIGNLRRETYLDAMLQVYLGCYNVLKPGGLMILVTKDFIRKGKRVLLSVDTINICEQAGFVYEDWHERRLTQQSFWRTLYQKKHPEVEKLETEDILVFRKSEGAGIVDAVITSPPYAETFSVHAGGNMRLTELNRKTVDLSDEEKQEAKELAIYSRNERNISNLPYGLVDTIVTSHPFAETRPLSSAEPQRAYQNELKPKIKEAHRNSPDNIGNLSYDGGQINDEWVRIRQGGKGES